ncbi:MAG: serine/threonine-protein kinase [Isosphaeraceae bacterium]
MKPGDKLGSFTIGETLGEGAMGVVYRAVHDRTGKIAAIKVISSELATKGNAAERFEREAEILKQFSHPNIVRFYAYGRYQKRTYLAMEFIPGKTLDRVLARREMLPWEEVLELGVQLSEALHYAHQKGVVHRDLKPSNLMITDDGVLKLTDFGIAKDLDATALTGTGRTLGTAAYMAPEQIRGTPAVSHKTDLYALGAVLYEMLTGRPPFQGKSAMILMHAHLSEPAPRVSGKVPDVPKLLDDLVNKLLAKEPADRPWDAADVSHRLAEIRKKAATGKLARAFPGTGNPERGGMPTEMATSTAAGTIQAGTSAAAKKRRKGGAAHPDRWSRDGEGPDGGMPPWLGTAGLIAALVLIVGFAGYMLFVPYGEDELMKRAGDLMKQPERQSKLKAQEDYFPEIERRFPQHRQQVQDWRDEIALEKIRGRANVLEKPNLMASSKPSTPNEAQYVAAYTAAEAAARDGDQPHAYQTWKDLAEVYNAGTEEDARLWARLAKDKADAIQFQVNADRDTVLRLLSEADGAAMAGRANQALTIRRQIIERYGKQKHLVEFVAKAAEGLPKSPESESEKEKP